MPDTQQIVGSCAAIVEKPTGWTEFEITVPGMQYPVRLATKRSELIEAARETKGGTATWTYTETEGNTNPHTGKPYMNRYLEGVELGGGVASNTAGGTEGESRSERYTQDDIARFEAKERRDFRSRAWGQTVSLFSQIAVQTDLLEETKRDDLFAAMQAMHRKIYEDICQSFAYPPDESDIPF